MLIQHILTEDIFITVFNNANYHKENNISNEMAKLADTFFIGEIRQNILLKIDPYIKVIKAAASNIADHHEKQKFLKVFYENFYKAYSPAKADRLGIIYTPNEIVDFMIRSTNYLLEKYFDGKTLADKNVEILDPAAGTGTYITELIEYIPNHLLPYKYSKEIHCNEVAILPYYVANLNIEYTYAQKMGDYKQFKNICFVDTLDNMGFSTKVKQMHFLSISAENLDRIKNQNERKISVIIGNPPYNANQLNENENNKNREYQFIDKRIKDTYVKQSMAQKTKLYDMYSRFIRWASDRLDDNGILAFITNRSLIDAKTYDGFRKVVSEEFSAIYIVDLGGDVRKNTKLSGPKHNVFAIQTGVAISFFIKKKGNKDICHINYFSRPEMELAKDKLQFLATTPLNNIDFNLIHPDKNNNWINLNDNEWDNYLALRINKKYRTINVDSIFLNDTPGVVTARDEWVYDFNKKQLELKLKYFISVYIKDLKRYQSMQSKKSIDDFVNYSIKWSAGLKNNLICHKTIVFSELNIIKALYRPFITKYYYYEPLLSDRLTSKHIQLFGKQCLNQNNVILINLSANKFRCLITNKIYEFGSMLDGGGQTSGFPLYLYDKYNNRSDNITDWTLELFHKNYQDKTINKKDIFNYVYAVLNNPVYQKKYEINLKREFPRVPFYSDFWKWADYGKKLMELHLNYEIVKPYSLKREDKKYPDTKAPPLYKAKLKQIKRQDLLNSIQ
jgi:predicted helicase